MTASEIVDRIIARPSVASRLLANCDDSAGISKAFFVQVHRLFVEDHSQLAGLHRATRLILRYGDDPAFGYRSLGVVERVLGRWLPSAQAFLLAGDHAQRPQDRLSFQIGAIDGLARSGRIDQAVKLGHDLADNLASIGDNGLAARARLNLGYALMEQDRFEEASRELDGLPGTLRQAGYVADSSSSRLALSTSHLFGGNPLVARREALLAAEEASAEGSHLLANIAKGNVAYADLLHGDADVAISALLSLRDKHTWEPVELVRILEYIGDAYVAMNLFSEAVDSYAEAESMGVSVSALHRAHLRFGMGQAFLAANRPADAKAPLGDAARIFKRLGNNPWTAAVEIDLAQADLLIGHPHARRRLRRAVELAKRSAYPFHLCKALIISAENGGPTSDLDMADKLLKRSGLQRLSWRINAERGRRSLGAVRLRYFRKMLVSILSDQARTSSVSSRVHFLHDKQGALRLYIEELLLKPTSAHIREAISAITRLRAVTLLDEVVAGRRTQLSEAILQQLSKLRNELNVGSAKGLGQGTRRSITGCRDLDHLQRRWIEATYSSSELLAPHGTPRLMPESTLLYVEGPGPYRVLSARGVHELPVGERDLERWIRWLTYDLLAPMADLNSSPDAAMQELRRIAEAVIRPVLSHRGVLGVCPEGVLWRVPWMACLDALDVDRDLELRLHPALQGPRVIDKIRTTMLWIADHQDLPRAEEEAQSFLAIYPDAVVCRTAEDVRCMMLEANVSLLHVISHSRHRASHPMFSSLDFADGVVLAAEIARSAMRADFVTLSGCDTGRLSGLNRFEPDGLVRAFLACGAGYVVGSAWPLDDEAALRFYSTFFKSFDFTANVNQSLRIARETVRRWKGHPYYWAFPLLYAGYRI